MMHTRKKLSNFVFDPIRQIALHPERMTTDYQDGGESYLLDVVSSVQDRSSHSREFRQYIKDWPSRYHLSKKRANILEGLQEVLPDDARVLEIGSGCGAITRWLGERYAFVDALEGSEIRAEITRKRTEDLDSVTVYCGNLQNTEFDKEYDLIVMIGVLEYLPLYDTEYDDPIEAAKSLLSDLSVSLSDKGILLIAIENKLGAKYFSGCREDHTSHEFEGLIGYPDKTPVTFSRNEMQTIISESGYPHCRIYHLFPDYKLTETIVAEKNEVLSLYPYNWIRTPFEDYSSVPLYLFPDALFLKTVTDAGLLWHFSNSFLVLASRSEEVNLEVDWLIKKIHNSDERKSIFHHTITLSGESTPSGMQYTVNRTPMEGGVSSYDDGRFSFELMSSEHVSGRILALDLLKALFTRSPEKELMGIITSFHKHLILHYSTGEHDQDGYPLVKGSAIDYTFWNVIVGSDSRLFFIDRKWSSKDPIPVDFVIFRNLYYIFESIKPFVDNKNMHLFVTGIMRHLFPEYTYERMVEMVHREEEFQQYANVPHLSWMADNPILENFFGEPKLDNLLASNAQTYCYVDAGEGFSEKQKILCHIYPKARRSPLQICFNLSGFNDVKSLRWDPIEGRLCHISIDKIRVEMKNGDIRLVEPEKLATNGERISDNELRFNTIDPWIVIPAEGQINNVVITGSWLVKDADETIPHLNQEIVQSNMKIQSLQETISERDAQVALLDEQVEQLTEETQSLQGTVSERDAQVALLDEQIRQQATQLMQLSNELASMKQSVVWRLLMKFHNGFVERIFPQGTRRRGLYDRWLKGGRILVNDGWDSFCYAYREYNASKTHPNLVSVSVEERILQDPKTELTEEKNDLTTGYRLKDFLSRPKRMLKFPKFENPTVSIVILTFNKAAVTYQCLESLLAHTDVPYELILVDNGSTDETSSLLDRLENVVIIRNSENLGFILGCNNGAKSAKGEFLLFLNNDTVVTPGWLAHLVQTIETYPKCGAVGCKLVWPNGLLQEAGSIIWSDGSALGYGRGDNPFKPEYSYLREVDYCSGACLLVRKELFWALNGFDSLYAPAYYEDSDICLGIQKLGYKMVFQPAVTVFHHEFTSSTPDKARELMMHNQVKFLAKRKDLLCHKETPSLDNVLFARDTCKEKTVLVLDDRIPVPGQGSGYPRANELLKFLGELGYKTTFFPLDNTTPWQPCTFELQQLGIEVFYGDNLDFNKFAQERLGYYDIVIVSRPHNLEKTYDTIKACFSNAYLIYDAEAMFSVREILKAKSHGVMLSDERIRAMMGKEICLMKKADMITTVSENEKQLIIKKGGLRNAMVIGHSINTQDYNSDFNARKDILFVGGFLASNGPNDDAVLYFVKEIWPRVQKNLSCKFYIVGINPPDSVKNLASSSVIVTGFVPDLQEYYDKCRLFVVPHRYAAGIPWKLQEAMSYGIPSVVSELMASQLNLQDGKEVLVASNPDEFSDKIIELYQNEDLWRQLQMNAIKYIETECSPLNIKNTLKTIMDEVILNSRDHDATCQTNQSQE